MIIKFSLNYNYEYLLKNIFIVFFLLFIWIFLIVGEKLNDDEVEQLLTGHEDSQGNVNYEEFVRNVLQGWNRILFFLLIPWLLLISA